MSSYRPESQPFNLFNKNVVLIKIKHTLSVNQNGLECMAIPVYFLCYWVMLNGLNFR